MVFYKCMYCQKKFDHKALFNKHNKTKCSTEFEKQIQHYKSFDKFKCFSEILLLKNKISQTYKCEDCCTLFSCFTELKNHIIEGLCEKLVINKQHKANANVTTNSNSNNTITNSNNTITNSNNTANTVNINNNFNLVPFDKIQYDYVSEDVLKQIFEVPGEALPLMTKVIFFDKTNPENNIIFCPNLKDEFVYVYTNSPHSKDGWERQYKKDFYSTLMQRQLFSLDAFKELLDDDENYLDISSFSGYEKMSKAIRTDKKVKKEYIDKIAYISYDNRELVKNTKSKLLHNQTKPSLYSKKIGL